MQTLMQDLVIFDLDNTLIKGQSQKILIHYLFAQRIINIFVYLKIIFWFFLYHTGLTIDPKPIMEYAIDFLTNKTREEFKLIIEDFFKKKLQKNIFLAMTKILEEHKKNNRKILIISNAIEFIPQKITEFLGADYFIGTVLETRNGKFTGKIENDIIYGIQKVNALKEFVEKHNFSLRSSWAYSDHESDIPLLEISAHPFAVNPTRALKKEATKRNWPTMVIRETIS